MAEALSCKYCGAPLDEKNITDGELAVCDSCSALNNLSTEPLPFPDKNKAKRKNGVPRNMVLMETPEGLKIRYRWRSKQHWFFLLFSIVWNIPVFFMVFMMVTAGFWLGLLFISIHATVGIAVAYFAILGFMNYTEILIGHDSIGIIARPLPAFNHPDKSIDIANIEQVYCKRRQAGTINEQPFYEYDVYYAESDSYDKELLKGVPTHEEALFIEQQIEGHYGIEDEPNRKAYTEESVYGDSRKHKSKNG